jgi:mannitol/fructose-specific phosphotransferase system IIA component (Ntr-type)
MPTALIDLLHESQVILDLRTRQMPEALRRIMRLLATNNRINEPEKFLEQVLAREQAPPNAVENGVAFPHARTELVKEIVIGIGRSRSGILFSKGKPARLIFLIGVPQQLVNDYLICVGTLARLLKDDVTRAQLLEVQTPREFLNALTRSL